MLLCDCPDCNDGKILDNWKGYCENAMMENEIKHMKSKMNSDLFSFLTIFCIALLFLCILAIIM